MVCGVWCVLVHGVCGAWCVLVCGVCGVRWSVVCTSLCVEPCPHQLFSDREERMLLYQTHLEGIYREFVKSVLGQAMAFVVVAMVIGSASVSTGRGRYT